MERVIIKAKDGYRLCLHVFEVENPKGYVQIIHGMEEHQERYERLAERLNAAGYTVVSSDMRGHGETAPILGYFGERDGWYYLIMDQIRITSYIRQRFQVEKVIIFAHSMGTIIARNLLQSQSKRYEKVILSGYPCANPAAGFGIVLTGMIQKWKGGDYYSKLIQKLAIGTFNRKIQDHKTDVDWISVNEDNVQAFIEDPYCGHGFRIAGFRDLFRLVQNMTKTNRYRNVQEDLPILAIRGAEDPCTGGEQGSTASLLVLQKAGFTRITSICYSGMRHEILNEKENEQVYTDILHFLG
ncbi:MAG: alpha/beta hydrolase [Lachnospiraceae bacterium]|nr:alpha/beta hydrolase [Lachnospiraceae bacterium]